MLPFSFENLVELGLDPVGFFSRPEWLYQPVNCDEVRYHFDLGILQASEGQTIPDVTDAEAEGCDYLLAYLAGFRGELARRAA